MPTLARVATSTATPTTMSNRVVRVIYGAAGISVRMTDVPVRVMVPNEPPNIDAIGAMNENVWSYSTVTLRTVNGSPTVGVSVAGGSIRRRYADFPFAAKYASM